MIFSTQAVHPTPYTSLLFETKQKFSLHVSFSVLFMSFTQSETSFHDRTLNKWSKRNVRGLYTYGRCFLTNNSGFQKHTRKATI